MIINEEKFKTLLKNMRLTKSALCERLGISSRTIAKIAKGEEISEGVVTKITAFLDASFDDICDFNHVLERLRKEKLFKVSNGLYHETQIKLTYNSNHIEGSMLSEEQTRYIFQTKTIGNLQSDMRLDDVIETNNHFKCVDYCIDNALVPLSQTFITNLQYFLKEGTCHSQMFGAGKYKTLPNTVGGVQTVQPEDVEKEIGKLLAWYNGLKRVTFRDIVEFHVRFETIHPFQDGNGRVGRLIAFKECLKNKIVPFYIDDANKWLYYRGLSEWKAQPNYLIETCFFGQDQYKMLLDYFGVNYEN